MSYKKLLKLKKYFRKHSKILAAFSLAFIVIIFLLLLVFIKSITTNKERTGSNPVSYPQVSFPLNEKEAIRDVKARYNEFANFPDKTEGSGFGPATITANFKNEWYVTFIIKGSGVYIASATCFKIDSEGFITKIGNSWSAISPNLSPITCKIIS